MHWVIRNLGVAGSNNPPHNCYLVLFSVVPSSTSQPLANTSQPPVGILKILCSIFNSFTVFSFSKIVLNTFGT